MGYYMAGDYYMAGGGIFSSIGHFIGGVANTIGKLGIPGVSGVAGEIGGILAPPRVSKVASGQQLFIPSTPGKIQLGGGQTIVPEKGVSGVVHRLIPGGSTGYVLKKRRRMNVANPKALRRAIRREAGFVKLAKRALKGTGYHVARRGSSHRSHGGTVRETINVRR